MKTIKSALFSGMFAAAVMAIAPSPRAQQINGTPGLPDATVTIDGKQLPPPALPFGGVIKESAVDSKPYWPPRVVPPKGAPNVLLIMTDDQGYGVSGTFGGVIPTPALERIAKAGLRYTQFHSTALCSPTRAALITGRNHHSVGYGVIGEMSTGYPGYDSVIGQDDATIGEILKEHGYATAWFGKNHNTPTYLYSAAGPFDQWPIGMGFQYFYGFMGGETDQWTPYLYQNTTPIFPWIGKPGYNLTTDMADEAIKYMSSLNAAAPDQPFFVYYVPGGTHSPHQPKPEWRAKFKGKFDMGWEKLREDIFANQKRLGVIPEGTQLTPWPDGQPDYGGAKLPRWDSLSLVQKKLYAREAENYAGYAAYTDNEIGRVIQAVEDMGKLDNTLIIYISGDNGTSAEGTLEGTFNQMTAYNAILTLPEALQMLHYEDWGSAKTYPHMSVAWSWAFDTPFKWTKQVASHFGGTRQGLAISWPGHITDVGGIRTQFHHVIDIVPPFSKPPGSRRRTWSTASGRSRLKVSAWPTRLIRGPRDQVRRPGARRSISKCSPTVASTTTVGTPVPRRLRRFGSSGPSHCRPLTTTSGNSTTSPSYSQANDLAAKNPDKLKELQALFMAEAAKYQVFPLDNSVLPRIVTPRPSAVAGKTEFTYKGENANIPVGNAPSILDKDYTITAEITVPKGGAEGMIATMGGRFGGYGLYLLKGKPVFTYNLLDLERYRWEGGVGAEDWLGHALAPGKHTIVFDFKYDGPGPGKGGTGVMTVDGKEFARKTIPHTIPMLMAIDESFDIGSDTRTGVDDSYKLPFHFTGTIEKLTYKLGPNQMTAEEQKAAAEAVAKATD